MNIQVREFQFTEDEYNRKYEIQKWLDSNKDISIISTCQSTYSMNAQYANRERTVLFIFYKRDIDNDVKEY